jgi:hypothetical protein
LEGYLLQYYRFLYSSAISSKVQTPIYRCQKAQGPTARHEARFFRPTRARARHGIIGLGPARPGATGRAWAAASARQAARPGTKNSNGLAKARNSPPARPSRRLPGFVTNSPTPSTSKPYRLLSPRPSPSSRWRRPADAGRASWSRQTGSPCGGTRATPSSLHGRWAPAGDTAPPLLPSRGEQICRHEVNGGGATQLPGAQPRRTGRRSHLHPREPHASTSPRQVSIIGPRGGAAPPPALPVSPLRLSTARRRRSPSGPPLPVRAAAHHLLPLRLHHSAAAQRALGRLGARGLPRHGTVGRRAGLGTARS